MKTNVELLRSSPGIGDTEATNVNLLQRFAIESHSLVEVEGL